MAEDSFGAAFGRLVKRKRAELRLTQGQLAESVWPNDENAAEKRKPDISKLETGKIANPHTTTVQRIADVLDVSPQEIDALHRQAQMTPAEQLDAVPTLSRNQLELLATRFEIERAFEMSDPKLRQLLKGKAEEYRTYRAQFDNIENYRAKMESLDDRLPAIHNLKGAAQEAAGRLDFEEVETLLSRVDEVETEIAAETKETRARNALLRGRVEQAYTLLTAAADSFASVDPLEVARRKGRYAEQLYHHGLRYGGTGLGRAADMCRAASGIFTEADHPVQWATAMQNLALALREQGTRTGGAEGAALLAEAVESYRAALRVFTEADHPVQRAMTMQNLAVALQEQGTRTGGTEGAALLGEAVESYRAALRVLTEADHPVDWAMTMQNLAIALEMQGTRTGGAEGAALLAEAVESYRAALRVRTEADHPVQWGMTMQNLAGALHTQGTRTGGAAGAALLGEAVESYRAALRVSTEADHPVDWATTRYNMALLEESRADHDTRTDPRPHLEAGLAHVMAALTVYDPEHMPYDHGTATTSRAHLAARLAALPPA